MIDQVQNLADVGTKVINTRLWLTDPDPNSFPTLYQRLEFPPTQQSLNNIKQYAEDIAKIKTPNGDNLDLYFTILWQGCADYSEGYDKWCQFSWDEFTEKAKQSIDLILNTIGNLEYDNGNKIVNKVFFDGEVIIEKHNTDKMLTQIYPYFVSKAESLDITPSIYFMINRDGSLDRFFTSTINFMKNNQLFIPSRLDISFYPIPGFPSAFSTTGYGALVENTISNLISEYPNNTFAIAETYYLKNPTARKEFGEAFARSADQHAELEELLIWPDYDFNSNLVDENWNPTQPYDISSYLLNPPINPQKMYFCNSNSFTCTQTTNIYSDLSSCIENLNNENAINSNNKCYYSAERCGRDCINNYKLPGDLNNDGTVNILDFNLFISNYNVVYTILDFNNIVINYGKNK